MGGVWIIAALEEAEEADAVVVKRVVGAILDRGDAADRPAALEREKELPVRVAIERVRLPVERVAHGDSQRRDPLRVIDRVVDLPGQIDEAAQVARGFDWDDFDRHASQCNPWDRGSAR